MSLLLRRGILSSGVLSGALTLNGASLNGSNKYFGMGDQTEFDIAGDLTISVFVKLNALDSTEHPIVTKYDFVDDRSYSIHIRDSDNNLAFTVSSDGENSGATTVIWTGATTGVWYHVVGIHDGTDIKLYVDDDLKGTSAHSGGIHSGIAPLYVGRRASEYADICVDRVDLYNADMTANIGDFTNANGDAICRADRSSSLNASSNVGSWDLGNWTGHTGSEITDISANSNDATNNGSIAYDATGQIIECS